MSSQILMKWGKKCEQLKYLEIKAIDIISGVSNGGGVQGNR